MSTLGLSGQQIAVRNLEKFNAWVADRDTAADWPDYIRQGKLNRSEIARECGFALSVFRQNPAVKSALEALEARLLDSGILAARETASGAQNNGADAATSQSVDRRILEAKSKAEQRVKALEEQNAVLKAEVHDLRDRLGTYQFLEEHLSTTGRFLQV